jgi:hypothetical protein
LLKDDSLKAIAVNLCQTFWASWTHVIFVEYDMCSPLLFPPHLRMSTILLEFGRVRLVINQSVVSLWSGVFTRR